MIRYVQEKKNSIFGLKDTWYVQEFSLKILYIFMDFEQSSNF